MTSPLPIIVDSEAVERKMKPILIALDPKGLWSRYRFEFCNALEEFCDMADDVKARAELERLGARISDPVLIENAPYKDWPLDEQVAFLEDCYEVTRAWCGVWKRKAEEAGDDERTNT